jgi:hypothetical protein
MSDVPHIGKAVGRTSVPPEHPWMLEREGRIPRIRWELNGRVYPELDLALPRLMREGRRPRRLRGFEEPPGATP